MKKNDEILERALARLHACEESEAAFLSVAKDDLRFLAGNSDNGFQWAEQVKAQRQRDNRPCLTINQLPQFVRQVVNDARETRPAIKVHPVEDADVPLAEIIGGIIRSIEQDSDAETAYDTALESAVACGVGYWRIVSVWADAKRSKQKLVVQRIRNRFAVHLDPLAQDPTGADARFAFIEDWISPSDFKALYGETALKAAHWFGNGQIRIIEYFEKDIQTGKITWYKICGNTILDTRDWAGRYIPIIRVIGEEYDLGGQVRHSAFFSGVCVFT